jgi:ribonuclease P protein subunit RPR2
VSATFAPALNLNSGSLEAQECQAFSPDEYSDAALLKHKQSPNNHMAETKDTTKKIPNRQAYSRISFLYQASSYFATLPNAGESVTLQKGRRKAQKKSSHKSSEQAEKHGFPVSAYLGSHLMTIGRKGIIRIAPSVKRSICKRCKVLLREGSTSAVSLENKSLDGSKPHADMLLVACLGCGMEKRYPLGSKPEKIKAQNTEETAIGDTT